MPINQSIYLTKCTQ